MNKIDEINTSIDWRSHGSMSLFSYTLFYKMDVIRTRASNLPKILEQAKNKPRLTFFD